MYKTTLTLSSLILYICLFALPALGQDGETTIVEIAAGNENFSTLVTALDTAGLVEVLSGEGPFTVFAPTNEAFEALAEGEFEALLHPENRELLTQILSYHIIEGTAMASDVVGTGGIVTLQGSAISLDVDGEVVRLNGRAQVIQTDIEASNGVIHVIDSVLLPPVYDAPPRDLRPSLRQVSDDLKDFAQTLELPLSLESADLLAQTSESNIEYWASDIVDAIPAFLYAEGQYDVVPFQEYASAEYRKGFAQRLMSGEGFHDVGWEEPPLEVGDYVARADWRIDSPQNQGETEFSYFVVVDESGVKFDPVRWLTPEVSTSETDVKERVFWSGATKNKYGFTVVAWEFSVEFVSVDECEMRGLSVNKMVTAPAPGWSAEGDTGYSTFCMEKPGCNCNNNDMGRSDDQMTCVSAEAALGYGSGSPDIGISSGSVGVTVGGIAFASYEATKTYRVCADGQELTSTD